MAVRLKDVAEKTGYSINTVSRVVNKNGSVSPYAREIIEKTLAEMNYVSNAAAKGLRTGQTKTIALILDDLINPHFSVMADEISLYAAKLGYNVIIYTSNGNAETEAKALHSAATKMVDGILLCPVQDISSNINFLKKLSIPFVIIERAFGNLNECSYVVFDETRIGFLSAEYLIMHGHRKVLTIVSEDLKNTYIQRLDGIIQAFHSYGMSFDRKQIFSLSLNIRSQRNELVEILNSTNDYTAIICFNDITALTVSDILNNKEIPIVGFGNICKKLPFNSVSPFVTIDCQNKNISISGVDSLLSLINKESVIQQHILPVCLIE